MNRRNLPIALVSLALAAALATACGGPGPAARQSTATTVALSDWCHRAGQVSESCVNSAVRGVSELDEVQSSSEAPPVTPGSVLVAG